MGTPTYSLQFDGLTQAVEEINSISRQINEFLEELQNGTMKAILLWESGARDLFDSQRSVWNAGATDMATQATNAQNALREIMDHYAHGERRGYDIWNR